MFDLHGCLLIVFLNHRRVGDGDVLQWRCPRDRFCNRWWHVDEPHLITFLDSGEPKPSEEHRHDETQTTDTCANIRQGVSEGVVFHVLAQIALNGDDGDLIAGREFVVVFSHRPYFELIHV